MKILFEHSREVFSCEVLDYARTIFFVIFTKSEVCDRFLLATDYWLLFTGNFFKIGVYMQYYVIKVQRISEMGEPLTASTKDCEWFDRLIKDSIPEQLSNYESRINLQINKSGKSLEVVGGIYIEADAQCDRCLGTYKFNEDIPFRLLLEPAKGLENETINKDDSVEDLNEDLDFSFYSSDEIDLGDLIRQHLVLALSGRYLCDEGCKGICVKCGSNLNKVKCKCQTTENTEESPFSALKDYKIH